MYNSIFEKWRHYLIPKEVILYNHNHALQFIIRKKNLNQRHAKWVELMQNFTFFINHISGNSNKVADALRKICLILQEFEVETLGFEHIK